MDTKDVFVEVPVTRRESLEGCQRLVRLRRQRLIEGRLREYRETLRTDIPPLDKLEAATLRVRGKGHEGLDGTSGDAVLRLVVGALREPELVTARASSPSGLRPLGGLVCLALGAALPFADKLSVADHFLLDAAVGCVLVGIGISLLRDSVTGRDTSP